MTGISWPGWSSISSVQCSCFSMTKQFYGYVLTSSVHASDNCYWTTMFSRWKSRNVTSSFFSNYLRCFMLNSCYVGFVEIVQSGRIKLHFHHFLFLNNKKNGPHFSCVNPFMQAGERHYGVRTDNFEWPLKKALNYFHLAFYVPRLYSFLYLCIWAIL